MEFLLNMLLELYNSSITVVCILAFVWAIARIIESFNRPITQKTEE